MTLSEAQFAPVKVSRLRKAWCELTGGHDNEVNGAFNKSDGCWAFNLRCRRCGKTTRWYPVPRRCSLSAQERDDER